MLRRVAPAFIGLAAVLATTWGGGVAAHAATSRPTVYEIPITGPVDPFVANMVNRGFDRAQRAHAAAVLVRLDTPGGLDSSMRSIIKKIQKSTVPVICWVGPSGARAASAGAFILIGCPLAAMAPGTNVGAARPGRAYRQPAVGEGHRTTPSRTSVRSPSSGAATSVGPSGPSVTR